MPKPLLYIIILIETLALLVLGFLLVTQSTPSASDSTITSESSVSLSSREMTVYVKAVGKGDTATDVVGKVYVQDDATGRAEFLFDLGAGCFPTWTLDPQDGYHLLVVEDADVSDESLDRLMRQGALRYGFSTNSDVEIIKTLGIRSSTLVFDDQRLRLQQQCS